MRHWNASLLQWLDAVVQEKASPFVGAPEHSSSRLTMESPADFVTRHRKKQLGVAEAVGALQPSAPYRPIRPVAHLEDPHASADIRDEPR